MPVPFRASFRLARTLILCLVAIGAPFPAQSEDLLAWREAGDTAQLVAHLDRWIDGATELPRNAEPPAIRWASAASVTAMSGRHNATGGTSRGLYDPDGGIIWLAYPWDPRDPRDVAVLVHELVHHRQAAAGHWYCPGAQELPAYRAQEAWLAELGLTFETNWIAVVLEAGCTPRDIHPD